MKINTLLIDDDHKLGELLTEYLDRFEIHVTTAENGEDGLRMLRHTGPDCILLDIMLPGQDGFEICREIRKVSDVPVIMLTARGEVADRVVGLEIGADDYLPKPFEPRELAARIQAVLRRRHSAAEFCVAAIWKWTIPAAWPPETARISGLRVSNSTP